MMSKNKIKSLLRFIFMDVHAKKFIGGEKGKDIDGKEKKSLFGLA